MKLLLHYPEDGKEDKSHYYKIYNKKFKLEDDIFILLQHPEFTLICDSCERNLNHACSILLQLPESKEDLCFTCFIRIEKEVPQQCVYYVRPNLHMTLTEDKWDLICELVLLNALQKYSFGNWENVKSYMDSHGLNFTEKEIEQHYKEYYLQHKGQPILRDEPLELQKVNFYTPNKRKYTKPKSQSEDQYSNLCYNPKRNEYLFEYDPEAQQLIADLQFLENDSPEQTEMKMKLLVQYNRRIQERKKREEFVQEHKLLCQEFHISQLNCKKAKGEYRQLLAPFSRLMTFEDSQNVLDYLTLQETLKGNIRQLMTHRSRFKDPTFENAYQTMKKIKENRQKEEYRGAPQLKVQEYKLLSTRTERHRKKREITQEDAKNELLKAKILLSPNLQITNISPSE